MTYYNNIGLTEESDHLTKCKNSRECIVCHHWYFNHGFKFQKSVCNGCHDLLMMSPNINNMATSLLQLLISVALFMVLANLMQFICYKILYLIIMDLFKEHFKEIIIKSKFYGIKILYSKQKS